MGDRDNMNKDIKDYPLVLNVKHIMEILGVSNRVAYELMKQKDFPVMSINGPKGSKRIPRNLFFEWIHKSATEKNENGERSH